MHCFADTSYFLALLNTRDAYHDSALGYALDPDLRLTVSEFVFLELGNAMALSVGRGRFLGVLNYLRTHTNVAIVPLSSELFQKGEKLFADRHDKEWSLTDCISFVVMKEKKLTDALTSDHHFAQAGFKVLLS